MTKKEWVINLWNQPSNDFMPDWYKARRYINYCYHFRIINWKTYDLVLKRIQIVKNGTWMYKTQMKLS